MRRPELADSKAEPADSPNGDDMASILDGSVGRENPLVDAQNAGGW